MNLATVFPLITLALAAALAALIGLRWWMSQPDRVLAEIDALGLFEPSGKTAALASWTVRGDSAYLCALHSLKPGEGVAIQMLDAVIFAARKAGAKRLKAMLTNDNMPGMTFYQRRGFRLSGLYIEAIDAYRSVVPDIIKTGYKDIPIHDAIELEIAL